MSVIFKTDNHTYESQDPNENIKWISTTKFIELFKNEFDPVAVSKKCSINKKSKWYKFPPEDIQQIWKNETERAKIAGDFYHLQREQDVLELSTINRCGRPIPVISPIYDGNIKIAPVQQLVEGIYPEHFVYLKSAGICGQSDRVEIVDDCINVFDYKTNKKIDKESFKNWEGISKKMLNPISHLDDCNFNHYSLQLSMYAYIIMKHNPTLKIGKLILQHVIFDKEGDDKYGYPIFKKDANGNYIVKDTVPYECPFFKNEIRNMINWYLENKDKQNT